MINRMSINRPERKRGFLTVELVVAMAILLVAVFPLSYDFLRERQLSRACYYRAVAMEIVDGEMEVLQGGEWQAFAKCLGEGGPAPIPFESIVSATLTTFCIQKSRASGQPVSVDARAFMHSALRNDS